MDLRTPGLLLLLCAASCATPPTPPPAARVLRNNPRAVVEGRVVDVRSRPVSGISVRAIPRGAEIPWSPWATTDAEGRFRLALYAPGSYGFLLRSGETSIVTADPRDPGRLIVDVRPGQVREGIELTFLEAEWRSVAPAPARR